VSPGRGRAARAARCLLAVGALAAGCSQSPPPRSTPRPALTALQPSGDTTWPFTFTWEGAAAEEVVRVRVFDEAERQLYGIEARGNGVAAPEALRRQLDVGTPYLWRVSRVDGNGDETGESALAAFSVAGPASGSP
jgi:hypothetical protein